jgi:nitrogen regulatory protein PII
MTMHTFAKKQIRIICERPILKRVQRHLASAGVKGYTVFPALSGSGSEGDWDREGMIGDAGQMVLVVVVLDEEDLDRVLTDIFDVVSPQMGVITISDVEVVRPDRF